MKLTDDLKRRIDNYFDHILPEKLFDIAVNKYGFTVNYGFDLNPLSFDIIGQTYYSSVTDNRIDTEKATTITFAA